MHNTLEKYTVVIGLEVHAQLSTASKIYNSDAAQFGSMPNTNVSAITLGHPGTLPLLNRKVVEYAIKMGLACNSSISREMIFDRKNYFYPDLPKGYQITQDRTPICVGGEIKVMLKDGTVRAIPLTKIHIEEDAGKSMHLPEEADTLVDFNRAGVPLIEIVTEPAIYTAEEAQGFLNEVRRLVRYLDICDGNMEEGSLRCDVNISIKPRDSAELGKKVEVKNLNSVRNVQRAIEFEIDRQVALAEQGLEIDSETRNFDDIKGITTGMRTKETLNDYRYFPDPDLSPVVVSEVWLNEIRATMPALPHELYERFITNYKLPEYDARVLTDTKEIADYFMAICSQTENYKAASNWVMGPIKSYLNDRGLAIVDLTLSPQRLAEIISLVDDNQLSFSVASQKLLPAMVEDNAKSAKEMAELLNLMHDSDADSLSTMIDAVIAEFPDKVKVYQKGNKGLLGMFMGEVMTRTKGKADPKLANELLRSKLG